LILDNLGRLTAGLFRHPSTANLKVSQIFNEAGVDVELYLYSTQFFNFIFNIQQGRSAQVGKGTTPVTRGDIKIESAFLVAPESVKNTSLLSGYTVGLSKISMSTLISPTGGSGSITEVVKFLFIMGANQSATWIAIMRDIVSPASFIAGESINVTHEVLI
jgi:hypothetical protein